MEEVDDPETFIITDVEAGLRLDKILVQRFSGQYSRTYFQSLIDQDNVFLNGISVKKRLTPFAGDEVSIFFPKSVEIKLIPENIPLDILYEDESIIVINKPAHMVVHPAIGNWTGTCVNALLYHCKSLPDESNAFRPGIVHRLDKETSGVLVAAKTRFAQQKLVEQFSQRVVFKEYVAICVGNPGNILVDAPINRHPTNRKLMSVVETGGKPAVSHFQTIASNEKLSVVNVRLETGRTHQIRVHLKHLRHAVLGDNAYGCPSANAKYQVKRQLLHAHRLKFYHPVTGEQVEFIAPIPDDINHWMQLI